MRAIASLLLMCDPRDLGVALTEDITEGLTSFEPNLFLYDMYPAASAKAARSLRSAKSSSNPPPN